MAGVWIEEGRGEAVRQAVGAQAPLLAVGDPFSARRAIATESVAGLIVLVGSRTLSLRSLCAYVRRERPALPVIAVRSPSHDVDAELRAVVTAVIDAGRTQDVTDRLASVCDAFEAGEVTAVLPPPAPRAPAPTPAATPASSTTTTPAATPATTLPPAVDVVIGTSLTGDDVTETHVGVSVGSSMESEEDREDVEDAGPALLVRLAAERRTGRLLIPEGEGAGTLHFTAGAPVGAELPTGDAGLYRRLLATGLLTAPQVPPVVRQGRLLKALVGAGMLGEAQRLEFERTVLRDQVLAVSRQSVVRGVFVSTRRAPPVPTTPPLNLFGLVLEARRRTVAPEVITALFQGIAGWRITGTSRLAEAAHLVRPFCGGRDVVALFISTSARQLMLALDWDGATATLVLLAMRDAGLILVDETSAPTAAAPATTSARPTSSIPSTGPTHASSPRQLLGLGMAPDEEDIEAAYAAWMLRLDDAAATATSAEERAKIAAERERYDVARQALRLQLGFATGTGTNPF